MKKKGFTLIELLAVIVILAIIALIATPLVLKYIEKSRKESKVDSAYSFVRNLETQMANYAIEHNGTKYTTNKENIKELGLDIVVKGENPDDGKVCISSIGEIEKGVFKYKNYYVNYNGKKAIIISEDEYNNFNCEDVNSVLFEANLEFSLGKDNYYIAKIPDDFSFAKLEVGYEYDLLIDDEFVTRVYVLKNDGELGIFSNSYDNYVQIKDGAEVDNAIIESLIEIVGVKNVKIANKHADSVNMFFGIVEGGLNFTVGQKLVEGEANILIKDSDGEIYFDGKTTLENNNSFIYGVDSYCRQNIIELPELYNAVSLGKEIEITITQSVDGKDVISTLKGVAEYNDNEGGYFLGQFVLMVSCGC